MCWRASVGRAAKQKAVLKRMNEPSRAFTRVILAGHPFFLASQGNATCLALALARGPSLKLERLSKPALRSGPGKESIN